jgi:hypothetical protein
MTSETKSIPDLNDPCGASFLYRDLILCGSTMAENNIDNMPMSPESFQSLRSLATEILDPVVDEFGPIKLTYGFCSNDLRKHIKKGNAPKLDQHCAHEVNQKGDPVCERLGAAADFIIPGEDMLSVAKWIIERTPVDRLYYYGPERPIHVSWGPDNNRVAYELWQSPNGKRVPRRLGF